MFTTICRVPLRHVFNTENSLKSNTHLSCVLFKLYYSNRYQRQQVRGTRVAVAPIRRVSARVVPVHAVSQTVPGLTRSVPSSGQRCQVRDYLLRDNVLISKSAIRK